MDSREIDALVAEHVLKFKVLRSIPVAYGIDSDTVNPVSKYGEFNPNLVGDYKDHCLEISFQNNGGDTHASRQIVPNYSTDIKSALEIVDRIPSYKDCHFRMDYDGKMWKVGWYTDDYGVPYWNVYHRSDSLPLCIAMSALKTIPKKVAKKINLKLD